MAAAIDNFTSALVAVTGHQPRRTGANWSARCPAHEDREASLSFTEESDGRVLIKCFAGCTVEAIVAAVGLQMRDLFPKAEGGSNPPRTRATVQPPPAKPVPERDPVVAHPVQPPATAQPAGCTLAAYAEAKQLPIEFLQSLGVSDFKYSGAPAVRIPFFNESGEEQAVQFRVGPPGADGPRFRWRNGSKLLLYGLDQLRQARQAGYVLLVEGASDAHTAWHAGYPAVGIPGANGWKEERDAEHLDDLTVYIVVEPDRGGDAVLDWLGRSRIAPRARLLELPTKDLSDLHLDDPARFADRLEAALQAATPWAQVEQFRADRERRQAQQACSAISGAPRILDLFDQELARGGVVGERSSAMLLYLAITSRLFPQPVSVAVKGPSSGGKSYLVESVLRFFPDTAYYELSAMSEHALAYSEEDLRHRVLVIFEAAGLASEFGTYLMRSLLSEGRIRYETVEKTSEGMRARLIEREGPTALLITTTEVALHPENETRLLSLTVTDTQEQTALILRALANGHKRPDPPAEWHGLQQWLAAGPVDVAVPFADDLAQLVPPIAVRLRRDFRALLTLIRAHALLHRASRQTDDQGRIVATIDQDYDTVRGLVVEFFAAGIEATVPATVRDTVVAVVQAVANAHATANDSEPSVSIKVVATTLHVDKSSAWRRVRGAIALGYVRNLETRRGRPAKLVVGDQLPDDVEVLPTAERLHGCTRTEGEASPSPSEAEFLATCDQLVVDGDAEWEVTQ